MLFSQLDQLFDQRNVYVRLVHVACPPTRKNRGTASCRPPVDFKRSIAFGVKRCQIALARGSVGGRVGKETGGLGSLFALCVVRRGREARVGAMQPSFMPNCLPRCKEVKDWDRQLWKWKSATRHFTGAAADEKTGS